MSILIRSGSTTDELEITPNKAALVEIIDGSGNDVGAGFTNFGAGSNLGYAVNSEFVFENTGGYSTIAFSLTIPTGATVTFESSYDGTTWLPCTLRQIGDNGYVQTSNATESFIGSISGVRKFRVRTSALGTVAGSVIGRASKDTSTLEGIENGAPNDFELNIAEGKIAGHSLVNKAGYNADIDTASVPEDIWEGGGVYTGFPSTVGETITVVSTSPNDAAAGSGARTIRITGLDANYAIQSETFTLNGNTPVVGALVFTRVHTAVIVTSGSSNTAFNAGVITAYHTTTVANVFISMRVGTNQSNCSGYTIPAGYTGYVRKIYHSVNSASSTTSGVDMIVWTQSALKTTAPRLRRPNTTFYGDGVPDVIYGGLVFTEKTDLILRCIACSQNNTGVNGGYDLILVQD